MDLYKEILLKIMENEQIEVTFPQLHINVSEIIESKSYKALQKIKTIIEDDSLSDNECFKKVEEIVSLFEQLGSNGGNRHDFG